ncbi:unnamed protein product [Paramecium pentaurelia]|uniref:Transmembrane protein n=1 Tax=Paramecium pentaurelia TaxID=43138 RepID=A0A8S1XP87_9CILI|nr:unnamed protein product [Paramecium pentaurelia]
MYSIIVTVILSDIQFENSIVSQNYYNIMIFFYASVFVESIFQLAQDYDTTVIKLVESVTFQQKPLFGQKNRRSTSYRIIFNLFIINIFLSLCYGYSHNYQKLQLQQQPIFRFQQNRWNQIYPLQHCSSYTESGCYGEADYTYNFSYLIGQLHKPNHVDQCNLKLQMRVSIILLEMMLFLVKNVFVVQEACNGERLNGTNKVACAFTPNSATDKVNGSATLILLS